jgi:hypothetical protein
MKMKVLQIASAVAVATLSVSANAATLLIEDFEDANVAYTTSVAEFTDNSGDFFIRTNGSDHGTFVAYSNIQGSYYFAGMDLDGENATLPLTMTFEDIDIAGASNLAFSAYFAEDDDSDNEDWDNSDFFLAEYSIDGGAYQNLLSFANDGSTFNTAPQQDTDFDGVGDGAELTDIFTLFSSDILATGSMLDLRFTFQLDAGDEDIALDNISITGDYSPIPVPAAVWLLGSGLLGLVGMRRRKPVFNA